MNSNGRTQIARFLKARRNQVSPEQVGITPGGRRRTPGLRREEVAALAGISVDWYTWLEQGRPIQVSAEVVDCISKALQLKHHERQHLFRLIFGRVPVDRDQIAMAIRPTLQTFLDHQKETPTYVSNERWDIIGWNRAACEVFGNYGKMTERERNSVWRLFAVPSSRTMLGEQWEVHAKRRLAQFRVSYDSNVGADWWEQMVKDLKRESPQFSEWWPSHDIMNTPEGQKVIIHPTVGPLLFDHLTFAVSDAPGTLVTVNLPADAETQRRMNRLLGS